MICEIILNGRVQGVGCRYYCGKVGTAMKIGGSATNLSNGSVRVLVSVSSRSAAEEYAEALRINRFHYGFWGAITSVRINELSGMHSSEIYGDYTWK